MTLFEGWEDIAQYRGCSLSTIKRMRARLLTAQVVFYQLKGSPPKKRVMAHSHVLDKFFYGRQPAEEK